VSAGVPLVVDRAAKTFGRVRALDGASFDVRRGEILGLLGPNGAGKTTLIKAIAGRVRLDAGSVTVFGRAVGREDPRPEIGVVPQELAVYKLHTARENLEVFGRLYGVSRRALAERVRWALHWSGLEDRADETVVKFSGGMKRRLNIACSLLHEPALVLLDEPTVGLDPQIRQELWSLIDGLREQGVTALMSTHYIEEAERLADTVAVMNQGKIIAQGTPAELVRAHAGELVIEVYGPPDRLAEVSELAASNGWPSRRSGPAVAIMRAETLDGDAPDGVRRPANLEDAFVALTGEEIE